MFNKVFISYAKEDFELAGKLFSFLWENDFQAWMDKKSILPGQNWDAAIKKALRESDFIVMLMSSISVEKRGYVQREFKLALDYYEEKLEDDIYIIPCKIDNCQVPDRLSKLQWLELNSEEEYNKILGPLIMQRDKYLDNLKKSSVWLIFRLRRKTNTQGSR